MLTIKAHFDGKVFVPDEPLDLKPNQAVVLMLEPQHVVVPHAEPTQQERRRCRDLIGWALRYPANPNPRRLTEDELWDNPDKRW